MSAFGLLPMGAAIGSAVLVLDQVSKSWILDVVMQPAPRTVEVTGFFNLVLTWNRGVSFGMFQGDAGYMPYVLSAVAFAVIAMLGRWLWTAERPLQAAALGMIIGGAIGNMLDRLYYGAVCDFLDFHLAGIHFWAFNVADAGISVGVSLLLVDGLFAEPESS